MNKEANFNAIHGWTPQELFLASALGGGGAFGGLRLLTEAMNKVNKPKPQENDVKLMLPDPEKDSSHAAVGNMPFSSPKTANDGFTPPGSEFNSNTPDFSGIHGNGSTGSVKLLSAIAGIPAGFLGAKFLYDKYKGHEMQQQIDKAKQNYMNQLQLAERTKVAETPYTDAFCEAIADELNKSASDTPWTDPSTIHQMAQAPEMQDMLRHHYWQALRHNVANVLNKATFGAVSTGDQTMNALALGGGAATLGALTMANLNKRKREQSAQYPGKVTYEG